MAVEPGSVVVAPLGPRQLIGVAWEADRLKTEEVGDNRLRPLAGLVDVPPIPAALRRLCEWTADYYLAPLAAVLRMDVDRELRRGLWRLDGLQCSLDPGRDGAIVWPNLGIRETPI